MVWFSHIQPAAWLQAAEVPGQALCVKIDWMPSREHELKVD